MQRTDLGGRENLKILKRDTDGVWQFDPYFEYLERIRDQLPESVAAFACRWEHYSLDSEESLHDAWFEGLEVREPSTSPPREVRSTALTLRLLGPIHDRRHELIYLGVQRHRAVAHSAHGGHGDLIVHEFRLSDDGLVEHELLFASGAVLQVTFREFEHRTMPVAEI